VRHDRDGVGVNSLMQASEDTSMGTCDLGQFSPTFLTPDTASADEWSDDLAGGGGWIRGTHTASTKVNARSVFSHDFVIV